MGMSQIQLKFGSLVDTINPSKTPEGSAYALSNCTTEHGILEGGPRYVNLSRRTGYNAGDVAWGFGYGLYNSNEEYLAVIQESGNSYATVFSINPTTNVWTALTSSGQVAASQWQFTQFEDRFICSNVTGGIFYKHVGTDEWVALAPEFDVGTSLTVALDVPGYPARNWASPDTMTATTLAGENLMSISYEKVAGNYTGRMKLYAADSYTSGILRLAKILVNLSAPLNLDGVDFLYFGVTPLSPANDVGHLAPAPLVGVTTVVSTGGGGAPGSGVIQFGCSKTANDTYQNCINYSLPVKTTWDPSNPSLSIGVWVDLRGIPAADKHAGMQTIAIGVGCVWGDGQGFQAFIETLNLGGADFLAGYYNGRITQDGSADPGDNGLFAGDLLAAGVGGTYAYTFYNSTTGAETGATKASIADVYTLKGQSPYAGLPQGGAWALVTPSVPVYVTTNNVNQYVAGYDKIQVYRQINKYFWVCVAGVGAYDADGNAIPALSNSGTPMLIDKQRANNARYNCRLTNKLQFADPPAGALNPNCLTVWKGQLTLGIQQLVYMSWGGNPQLFMPAPQTAFIAPAATDTAQGATFYMSQNEADPIQGIASQDSLYLAGLATTYVVIGDSAYTSTPPRKLPGSRGAPGPFAVCPYSAGVLVGAVDGLWFYQVSRAFTGSRDNTMAEQEMTLQVRNTWQNTLMGTNPQNLVLVDQRDTIWAFRDSVYMRYTRPTAIDGQRRWETGTWTGLTVRFANYSVLRGLRALDATGTLVQIGQNASNTNYTTDNGTTVTYSYTTGIMSGGGGMKRVSKVQFQGSGQPSIEVIPYAGLGASPPVTFTRSSGGQVFVPSKPVPPGYRFQFVVSGTVGTDTVEDLLIWVEDVGSGEGN